MLTSYRKKFFTAQLLLWSWKMFSHNDPETKHNVISTRNSNPNFTMPNNVIPYTIDITVSHKINVINVIGLVSSYTGENIDCIWWKFMNNMFQK